MRKRKIGAPLIAAAAAMPLIVGLSVSGPMATSNAAQASLV
jgi:hypothetical protein